MKSKISIAAFIIVLAILAMLPSNALADTTASLSAVPSQSTVITGANFTVDVNISVPSTTPIFAYQLDLMFNPAVVSVTRVSEGTFLNGGDPLATFFDPGTTDNVGGTVSLIFDTLQGPVPSVSGNGTLVVFDFTALAPGTSSFTILNEILSDSNGMQIADTSTPGSITVQGSTTVPEPSTFLLLVVSSLLGFAVVASRKRLVLMA